MKSAAIRQKARRLSQEKLDRLKILLGAQSDSEALEQAVDLLLAEEDIKPRSGRSKERDASSVSLPDGARYF